MKKLKTSQIKIFFLLLFFSIPFYYYGSDSEEITIPLTNPGEPGLVSINHYKGSIFVNGYSGNSVIIAASYRNPENNNGMKLISNSAIKLNATEKENVVIISTNSYRRTIDLSISVPRNFSLKLSTDNNGVIEIRDISGELELNNNNGDVKLLNVSGSAIVSTIDGDIYADYVKVDPDQPMAFSTIEGKIDLYFPVDADICLKMKTEYGEIYSDFNINLEKRKTNVHKHKNNGSTKVSLDDWTHGQINKGGPEYLIKSLNGNIYIRKKK